MDFERNEIQNHDYIEETLISKCKPSTPSKSFLYSSVSSENKNTTKEEPQEYSLIIKEPQENYTVEYYTEENNKSKKKPKYNGCFSENQSFDDVNGIQDIVTTCRENNRQPPYQVEGVLVLNNNLAIKEENSSLSEEAGSSSQFDVLTTNSSQNTSNINCVSPNSYLAGVQFKNGNGSKPLDLPLSPNNEASPQAPSKQKLRYTKRRAGILYKQITSSKHCKITSKYFSQAHNNNKKRWIPPRSPYALVQEDLFDNPWQLLVATIFLTKTTAKKALPQFHKFIARYPRPEDVLKANYEDIDEYFKPLGLTTTRSHTIMRFTVEFLEKDWTYPRELYGIGKYGDDSYRMFCINELRQVSPDDIPLSMYRNWFLENAQRLGLE